MTVGKTQDCSRDNRQKQSVSFFVLFCEERFGGVGVCGGWSGGVVGVCGAVDGLSFSV